MKATLEPTKAPLKKATILVIDDEEGLRTLLFSELKNAGFSVETACDGLDALQKIKPGKFQLVITDMNMPHLNGLEAIRKIREIDPDVEIIMMTGYATVETAVTAMKEGAYDFIQKPFNLDEILLLVHRSLEKNELKTMMAVYKASRSIFESVQLDSLLSLVANLSLDVLKADDVSIMTWDKDNKLGVAASSGSGLDNQQEENLTMAIGENILKKTGPWKEPLLLNQDKQSTIIHPLQVGNELLGIIAISRIKNQTPFNQVDLRCATVFSSQISQAIYNAKIFGRLEATIKELKETQQQLVQSEKLAAMGQLAAGVAHELNNPLTGINGFAELLLDDPNLSQQQKKDLETIHEQSWRCRTIIQNLLKFSRRKEFKKEKLDPILLLKSTLELIQYEFTTSGIKISENIPSVLPAIYGDVGQLQQVFINLITNARQAIENTRSPQLTIEAGLRNDSIYVQFKDNGPGISKEILGKVFDPFFTTKPVGKGTGLGLSICYGIIQEHQGSLTVESEVGKGTIFTVEIPIYV